MKKNSIDKPPARGDTWHHIIAKSIGGPNIPENKYPWSKKEQRAYHQLFYTYLPSLVIIIIKEWTNEQGNLDKEKMGLKNFRAWKRVFGEQKPEEIIRFIEKRFLPIEKKFLKGELKNKKKRSKKNGQ